MRPLFHVCDTGKWAIFWALTLLIFFWSVAAAIHWNSNNYDRICTKGHDELIVHKSTGYPDSVIPTLVCDEWTTKHVD
jgi:hypothetical protein